MKIGFANKFLSGTGIFLLLWILLWLDWVTGYEVSIFPLYFVPVILGALVFDRAGGFVFVGLAVLGGMAVDFMEGHPYSSEWMRYEHGAVRLIVLSAVVLAFDGYRRTLDSHRRQLAALQKLLTVCPGCGQLRGGDGKWYDAADYREMMKKDTYCVCPVCEAKRAKA